MSMLSYRTRRRKLSVSIAEELAAYVAERARREHRPVSDVVNESLSLLRSTEADQLAAAAYVADADEALEWAGAAVDVLDEPGANA